MLPDSRRPLTAFQMIDIRRATAEDAPAIALLVNAQALRGNVLPRTFQSVRNTIEDWLVAEAGSEILGCVSLLPYTSGLVEVRSLVVQDSFQGLGIGTRLMEAIIGESKRRGIPTLFALTRKVPFFARFGFQVSERGLFPEKVWHDCWHCPFINHCDETAMVMQVGGWD